MVHNHMVDKKSVTMTTQYNDPFLGKISGQTKVNNLQNLFFYISTIIVISLTYMVSVAVNNFINDSLSLTPQIGSSAETNIPIAEIINTEVKVKKRDALIKILQRQNIPANDVQLILQSMKKLDRKVHLNVGQVISFSHEINRNPENDSIKTLRNFRIIIDKYNYIEVAKIGSEYISKFVAIPFKKSLIRDSAIIKTSFADAAKSIGLSNSNINDLVNIYSHQIDFQRQIHKNDKIDLIVEKYSNKDGIFSHFGKVLYASLSVSGKEYKIYRYSPDSNDQNMQYFNEEGKSAKRNLLRTPVPAARISSHYGRRKHPILGYTKMHKGVDFAAPRGTPILAAGDGVINQIGRNGAYGNFVLIKHNGRMSTAYAHATRFAKGMKRGSRVKQGQVIAYVGTTGRSTGPHLHYEVRINGKQVNPLSIKSSPGISLKGEKLEAFKSYQAKIHEMHEDLYTKGEIAMLK